MRQRHVIARAIALGADPASFEPGGVNEKLGTFTGTLGDEATEQAVTVAILRSHGVPIAVSPGGVKMKPVQAAEMLCLGFEAGIPDITIPTARPPAAIEFKAPSLAPKGVRRSPFQGGRPEQRVWLERLSSAGWRCAVCFTAHEAISLLHGWGVLPGEAPPAPTLAPSTYDLIWGSGGSRPLTAEARS